MGKELYTNIPSKVGDLISDVKNGRIGLPDLQRPFVWKDNKVRDLLDSMLRGFPIGYIMLWESPADYDRTSHIGKNDKAYKAPDDLVIDGQQRLTALLAAMEGVPIKDKNYKERTIKIAFNPINRDFKVWSQAYERSAEYISSVSEVYAADREHAVTKFRKQYIKTVNDSRERNGEPLLTEDEEIEVWSAREGEQRFDNHVDKLLNYIRFWQASGESEKTSIHVKTKHSQMVQEGLYRGGHVPYGYKLEHQGRTNKKNQQVRDLVIDEDEAIIVREIFDLLTNHGYGTNRVAQYLNGKGIKTKNGTTLWRGTSIRSLIDNPIYIGIYHMQGVQSEPFDHLKIIDEDLFMRCQQTVKARSTKNFDGEPVVFRTDTRSLLTGIIFCGHCGCRLCYNHQHEERKLASGGTSVYDDETYRCYRKISASRTCDGQSGYKATALNEAVEQQVRLFLSKLEAVPKERLVELASARNEETYKVAYKQAQKDFENAQKQVTALEEEAVKALTGESQLDLSIVNQMLLKHRAKLEAAQTAMEEAQTRMQAEQENAKATKAQVDELLSWAQCFDKADIGTKHLIVSRLIERVDVRTGYKVHIKFKISLKQFLGQE